MVHIVSPFGGTGNSQTLFLAGGISNCPDWQAEIIKKLQNTDLTLINPRRPGTFDPKDEELAPKQIQWEYENLFHANAVLFWFPCETLCPIVLLELGKECNTKRKIFVGCHPDYARKLDVREQLRNARPEVEVVYSLDELAKQVLGWCKRKY